MYVNELLYITCNCCLGDYYLMRNHIDCGPTGLGYTARGVTRELAQKRKRSASYIFKAVRLPDALVGNTPRERKRYAIESVPTDETKAGVTIPLEVNGRLIMHYFDKPPTDEEKEAARLATKQVEDAAQVERPGWSYNR